MSVRLLADGRIYHTAINPDGSTREHFHNGFIREAPDAYVLCCAECDAITTVPKNEANAEYRAIVAQIARGFSRVKAAPAERSAWDAFAFAREDGVSTLPAARPATSEERRTLRAQMLARRAAERG